MTSSLLASLVFVPLLASFAVRAIRRPTIARRVTIASCVVTAITSVTVAAVTDPTGLIEAGSPRGLPALGIGLDGVSAVLVAVTSALALAVAISSPRASLDARTSADLLLLEAATLGVLVSTNVVALAIAWTLTVAPLGLAIRRSGDPVLRRCLGWLVGLAVAPLVIALAAAAVLGFRAGLATPLDIASLAASADVRAKGPILAPLLLVAAAARAGLFPLHGWLPPVLERGTLPLAIPTAISPLGSFAASHVALTLFPASVRDLRDVVIVCGAASALYGALLAIGRHDARRQLAFVWISILGFVFTGIASLDPRAMSGALFYEVVGILAMTGLVLLVGGVQARTGTADMRHLGGLAGRTRHFATGYFLLGLGVVCFPGTAGFVSEDLLVEGLHGEHPGTVIVLLGATALNGVSLVRSFKRIFLGPPSPYASALRDVEDMLWRERVVATCLIVALLVGGFVPAPLLRIQEGVVRPTQAALRQGPAHR